jgi:hypothetical protein
MDKVAIGKAAARGDGLMPTAHLLYGLACRLGGGHVRSRAFVRYAPGFHRGRVVSRVASLAQWDRLWNWWFRAPAGLA